MLLHQSHVLITHTVTHTRAHTHTLAHLSHVGPDDKLIASYSWNLFCTHIRQEPNWESRAYFTEDLSHISVSLQASETDLGPATD